MKSSFRKLLEKNFTYIGEGGSRIVLALNNEHIMKVPKKYFGIRQNETEMYIYANAGYYQKYLCPIKRYVSDILIMAKAEPLENEFEYLDSLKNFCGDLNFYRDILELARIFRLDKNDIRATSSWGLLNNRKVLIDYGFRRLKNA